YPQRIVEARFFGPAPATTPVRCEARLVPPAPATGSRPTIAVSFIQGDRLWADLVLQEVCLPTGALGGVPPAQRVAFLRDRQFVAGMGLARGEGGTTVLDRQVVTAADWLPGTVAALYAADPAGDLCRQVAVKEHVARARAVHPSRVRCQDGASV